MPAFRWNTPADLNADRTADVREIPAQAVGRFENDNHGLRHRDFSRAA
jgi:hypothetical protein